ncbi:uncharacterized protein LOC143561996 [Bidens hawaiensis]|uniref:uncharacterized protein LOC143561996 n=1 Tax=Bidens hawaiensis TaxID=980011 RepID=UPI004048F910
MDDFCHSNGIDRLFSAPYTPQQNVVAERHNRTLIEAARTILSDPKLPSFFWGEAINVACFIQNRLIINKRLKETPFEVYYKTKQQVNYFKTYGFPCNLLHTTNKTAYRVYKNITKVIVESFNVDWQELNPTDARTGPNWLFDYDYLFNQFPGMCTPPSTGTQVPTSMPEPMLMQILIDSLNDVNLFTGPTNINTDPKINVQAIPSVVEYVPTPPSSNDNAQVAIAEELVDGNSDNTASTPVPVEPKDYKITLKESSWVEAMQDELLRFKKLNVWRLVNKAEHKKLTGRKWVFRNKKDDKRQHNMYCPLDLQKKKKHKVFISMVKGQRECSLMHAISANL